MSNSLPSRMSEPAEKPSAASSKKLGIWSVRSGVQLACGAYMTLCEEHAPAGAVTVEEWEKSRLKHPV